MNGITFNGGDGVHVPSIAGRIIYITTKPRLIRHMNGWVCIGYKPPEGRWLWRRSHIVSRYGVTPVAAWRAWDSATKGLG